MTFASSFRRSSVSGGTISRIVVPSTLGVRPISLFSIAFLMSETTPLSHAVIVSVRASGAFTPATCLSGTGWPYASTCKRSSSAGVARPVRTDAKSACVASPHFPIRVSTSLKNASPAILSAPHGGAFGRAADVGADRLTPDDAPDVVLAGHVEHDDRQRVVHAQS